MRVDRQLATFKKIACSPYLGVLLVTGILVHIFGFIGLKLTDFEFPDPSIPEPFIRLPEQVPMTANSMFAEQALLYDSEPLFLPTAMNAQPQRVDSLMNAAEDSPFTPYSVLHIIQSVGMDAYQVNHYYESNVATPEDVLKLENPLMFNGFGQNHGVEMLPAAPRDFSMAIYSVDDGMLLFERNFSNLDDFPIDKNEGWSVIEMLIIMDAAGFIGKPLVVQSTGKPELNHYLEAFCRAEIPRFFLDHGYFRVVIGP